MAQAFCLGLIGDQMQRKPWTKEQDKALLDFYFKGTPIKEIPQKIEPFRNDQTIFMIKLRLNRLGVSSKTITLKKEAPTTKEFKPSEKRRLISLTSYGTAKTLFDLKRHECHYPLGGILDEIKLFCGGVIFKNNYCKNHYDICYSKKEIKKK